MKIVRANPNGGNKLKDSHFPLHEDKEGNFGLLIGYIDKNTKAGDKLLIPMSLAREYADQFNYELDGFRERFKEFRPRKSFRQRLIELLGGSVVQS